MDNDLIEQLKELVEFMRANGVLTISCKLGDITLHPSSLQLDNDPGGFEFSEEPTGGYRSDYENPLLYPDGIDPIAERQRLKVEV